MDLSRVDVSRPPLPSQLRQSSFSLQGNHTASSSETKLLLCHSLHFDYHWCYYCCCSLPAFLLPRIGSNVISLTAATSVVGFSLFGIVIKPFPLFSKICQHQSVCNNLSCWGYGWVKRKAKSFINLNIEYTGSGYSQGDRPVGSDPYHYFFIPLNLKKSWPYKELFGSICSLSSDGVWRSSDWLGMVHLVIWFNCALYYLRF